LNNVSIPDTVLDDIAFEVRGILQASITVQTNRRIAGVLNHTFPHGSMFSLMPTPFARPKQILKETKEMSNLIKEYEVIFNPNLYNSTPMQLGIRGLADKDYYSIVSAMYDAEFSRTFESDTPLVHGVAYTRMTEAVKKLKK